MTRIPIKFKKSYPIPATNYQLGFTLIEAIVSASLFAITVTGISGIYVAVQRLNQTSTALQSIQQNIRFITEDLTKTVRNGQIDYNSYGGAIPQVTGVLRLLGRDGGKVRVSLSGGNLIFERPDSGAITNYNSREVKITVFQAYITPSTTPFPQGGGRPTEQPTVTIYIEIEGNINARDKIHTPFQITAATWQYPQ